MRQKARFNHFDQFWHSIVLSACLSCIFYFVLVPNIFADKHYYVSPNGNDESPGTKDKPFASIAGAQRAVRQAVASGLTSSIHIRLMPGTYRLDQPLNFDQRDSGTSNYSISYVAQSDGAVIVSGGRQIQNWKKSKNGHWKTSIRENASHQVRIRHLWVNNNRAVRARTPNSNSKKPFVRLAGAELAADFSRHTIQLPAEQIKLWRNPTDIEVVVLGNWEINRFTIKSLDPDRGRVELAGPHAKGHDAIRPQKGRWCYFENVGEELDQSNEWYFDSSTGTVEYVPNSPGDSKNAKAVYPRLSYLLQIEGTAEKPVENLHFRGICFQHAAPLLPLGGYQGIQACHFTVGQDWTGEQSRVGSAIKLKNICQSSFQFCEFSQLGGCGIELVNGCHDNLIEGNYFTDISGNAIMVGVQRDQKNVPSNNRIRNNHVFDCGAEYFGAVGIWVGFASETTVAHNLVHKMPYTGISVGWQWNPKPSSCRENKIQFNHVYDVTNTLCDGGCLYTLGLQPGTVIRGNHLHDARRSKTAQGAPNNGMFIDQGSKGFLLENNVVYNCSGTAIRFNQSQRNWHTWRENYFGSKNGLTKAARDIISRAGLQPKFRDHGINHSAK